MKLRQRYLAFTILVSVPLFIFFIYSHLKREEESHHPPKLLPSYYNSEHIRYLQNEKQWTGEETFDQCSMSRCFNYTKCLRKPLKVYVYPTQTDVIISPVYEKILRVIRESIHYTEDPAEACIFVLSLDTTDRDRISDNYIKDLSARIDLLPQDIWNEGRNHLVFNLYYGSYPDYSQKDIGFVTKNAIVAWASANSTTFRQGFDISFPLFHREHPLRVSPQKPLVRNPNRDRYLSSFKGKRYVYGIGSNTRDSLYHLHNRNSTIILTTCRHNTDWKKFEDDRCAANNKEYDDYDYNTLLEQSIFCLTPRGRRLGSFRFLEALRAGCIPVILSDGWELPFGGEIVDWSEATIRFHERAVFFTTDVLNSISSSRISKMKLQIQLIYHRYFSSVEKIVLSTIQIVFDRLLHSRFQRFNLLVPPKLKGRSSKFIAVLQATKKPNNRPTKIIDMLAEIERIEKIIILWPRTRGSPPEHSAFPIRQALEFVQVDDVDQRNLINLQNIQTDYLLLLFLDERLKFKRIDVEHLMNKIEEQPNRLVTYHALLHHQKENVSEQPNFVVSDLSNSSYSIGLLHFAAVHADFVRGFQEESTIATTLKETTKSIQQCPAMLFNVYMAERTLSPPVLLKPSSSGIPTFIQQNLRHYGMCLNKIIREGYEDLNAPLLTSNFIHLT